MLRVGENGLNWPILFRGLNSEFGCLPEKREIVDEKTGIRIAVFRFPY